MKIAVASSGLGHVSRGIETWAKDTAEAIEEKAESRKLKAETGKAEMHPGSRLRGNTKRRRREFGMAGEGLEVVLFAGGREKEDRGQSSEVRPETIVLRCARRGSPAAKILAKLTPGPMWRWGLKSVYGWEQFTFWLLLWPRLVRGRFDILHVQDPMLAYWCMKFRRLGLVRTKEILAHGTEEPPEFLARFDYVQHLAPWHEEQALRQRAEG